MEIRDAAAQGNAAGGDSPGSHDGIGEKDDAPAESASRRGAGGLRAKVRLC